MRRPTPLWMAPAVGLGLLLSACGGSDEPSHANESSAPSASPGASASNSAQPSAAAVSAPGLSAIVLASTDTAGRPAQFGAAQAALSGDGNFLAYRTPADEVAPDDREGTLESIQVRDLRSNAVVAACTSAKGEAANGDCGVPSLSHDGRFVAFESSATNLAPEDKNPNLDVFRKDLQTGEVVLVSGTAKNAAAYVAHSPTITADGRAIAFTSEASLDPDHPNPGPVPPVPEDGDGPLAGPRPTRQIYVKNLGSNTVTMVSRTTAGKPGDAHSAAPKISADGSTVAFSTRAGNIAGKPRQDTDQVLVGKVRTGKVVGLERLLRLNLPKFNFVYEYSAPSTDGSRIAYEIVLDTLDDDEDGSTAATTTDKTGVFVADLNKATVIHTVRTTAGATDHGAGCATLSADGKYLAYCTFRIARKAAKGGDGYVVYLAEVAGNSSRMMSGAPKGTKSPDARSEAISADGKTVVFRSANSQRGVEAKGQEHHYQMYVAHPAE